MRRHPHRRWPQRLRALLLVSSLSALAFWPLPSAEGDARTGREGHSARMPRLNEWLGFFRPVGEAYELDDIARYIEPRARLTCPSEAIVPYRGEHLRYARSAHVHRAFLPRLEKLEALVVEVATDIYGRAPRRLVHRGAYNCRHSRGRPERLSEHALGNALDLSGFDFGPLRRGDALAEGVPSHLRRSFTVRVDRHWSPSRERDALHARFLHTLADRLHARPDIVRGIVGPPARRHHDHLHVDVAPWRYARYRHDSSATLSR